MNKYEIHALEHKDDGSFRMRLIISLAILLHFFGSTLWFWALAGISYIIWRTL